MSFLHCRCGALFLPLLAVLSACQMSAPEDRLLRASETPNAPAGSDPNSCVAQHVRPAVIETVTEQVLAEPARTDANGTVISPAVYRTETRQQILQDRQEMWFIALCEDELTPDFVASLQRALEARGLFYGTVNGRLDHATRRAIRAYQKPRGVNSDLLSLTAARQMGLKAVPRDN
nr:peptidoglycan-binding domain-containing protein [uncultured Celeribacter sp.]